MPRRSPRSGASTCTPSARRRTAPTSRSAGRTGRRPSCCSATRARGTAASVRSPTGRPLTLDPHEPERVASAVANLGLRHVVVTSVNRDDLDDGGAGHFASTAHAIKAIVPHCRVEVLVPDFQGNLDSVATVMASPIDVFNHNIETVPRLYGRVRPGAKYPRSLDVLRAAAEGQTGVPTKAGLMLGLGEERAELLSVFRDLREAGCRILTLGQYLRPLGRPPAGRALRAAGGVRGAPGGGRGSGLRPCRVGAVGPQLLPCLVARTCRKRPKISDLRPSDYCQGRAFPVPCHFPDAGVAVWTRGGRPIKEC
jgi:hypothetical protein